MTVALPAAGNAGDVRLSLALPARPTRPQVRALGRRAWRLVRGSDLAVAYSLVVVAVALVLAALPQRVHDRVVLQSSTNLANLRDHPFSVLLVSAFVVSDVLGLWMVPFLALAYAAAQRWLGRGPTVVAALVGHVGATLLVASVLVAGIRHGRLAASVAHEPDVGISYGLACVAALITPRVAASYRPWYVGGLVVFFVGPLLVRPTFTDLGHTCALALGFGLALLAHRAARAARTTADGTSVGGTSIGGTSEAASALDLGARDG